MCALKASHSPHLLYTGDVLAPISCYQSILLSLAPDDAYIQIHPTDSFRLFKQETLLNQIIAKFYQIYTQEEQNTLLEGNVCIRAKTRANKPSRS